VVGLLERFSGSGRSGGMKCSHKGGCLPTAMIFCAFFTFAGIACAGTYSGGTGTATDPYKISLPGDWLELIGTSNDWDGQFVLTQDLDMADIAMIPVAMDISIDPGYQGTVFSGIIDGKDHVIRNVTINMPENDYVGLIGGNSKDSVIRNLRIENVTITGGVYVGGMAGTATGTVVNCHVSGTINGSEMVGGCVGDFWGELGSYGEMISCSSSATVIGGTYVGGLAGTCAKAEITSCFAVANITGTIVGGLVGWNMGDILNCFAAGTIYDNGGGLVGYNSQGTITACYSNSLVGGTGGGLVDYNEGHIYASFWDIDASGQTTSDGGKGKTTNEMKTLSTFIDAGWKFIDINDKWGSWMMPPDGYPRLACQDYPIVLLPDLKGLTESEAFTMLTDLGLVVGESYGTFDSSISADHVTFSRPEAGTPVYSDFTVINLFLARNTRFSGGTGTANDPYRLATPGDWRDLFTNASNWNKYFIVMREIDLDKMDVHPIGSDGCPFTGQLNGAEHVIHNVVMGEGSLGGDYGLFGEIGASGQIQNLGVDQIRVTSRTHIGGFAACNKGSISRCFATGEINGEEYIGGLVGYNTGFIFSCYSTCKVSGTQYEGLGHWYFGGLVGNNEGSIGSCYSMGEVTGEYDVGGLVGSNNGYVYTSYATGNVAGMGYSSHIGGLVGSNGSNLASYVSSCYARGAAKGSYYVGGLIGSSNKGQISSCYSSGSVKGSKNMGGLVGYFNSSTGAIYYSFWDRDTSGQTKDTGGTAKTTAQMKQRSTFTSAGWDFVGESTNGSADVWRMCIDGVDYPRLSWEFSQVGDLNCPDGVAMEDLIYLAAHWTAYSIMTRGAADANGSGKVDLGDFIILSEQWMK
jgi:hypothetical protein